MSIRFRLKGMGPFLARARGAPEGGILTGEERCLLVRFLSIRVLDLRSGRLGGMVRFSWVGFWSVWVFQSLVCQFFLAHLFSFQALPFQSLFWSR